MQPPSDSFGHQYRKLAEVLADLRNRSSSSPSTTAPPPPYSTNAAVPFRDDTFSDVDCEDEDGAADATVTPITIKIDASISIVGHGNTVVIPSASDSSISIVGAGTGSTTCSSPSQTASSQTTTTQHAGPLQPLQRQQQARLSQLATSIIDALKTSRLLEDRGRGRCRPVELNINTGIRIQGSRNVVCAGARDRTANRNANAKTDDNSLERKRRAQSVCISHTHTHTHIDIYIYILGPICVTNAGVGFIQEPAEIPRAKRLPLL